MPTFRDDPDAAAGVAGRKQDAHATQTPAPNLSPRPSRAMIPEIGNWLMKQALAETEIERVVAGCCERLRAAGLPLARCYFAFTVLHPLHRAIGITWNSGKETIVEGYPHVPGDVSETFKQGPHYYMMQTDLEHLRIPLNACTHTFDFPIIQELKDQGLTDYLAYVVGFEGGRSGDRPEGFGMIGSWTCTLARGFNDAEIDALLQIEERLAVACKLAVKQRLMSNVTQTYLGNSASAYVLDGQIRRGDGQSIEAAIWYSDMRGSSGLADRLPRDDYIETLNAYFDLTGGAVHAAGGEILSFIGDALLAIFPMGADGSDAQTASRKAHDAAIEARAALPDVNAARRAAGSPEIDFGIALHCGEVMYGNVGVPERLTFSVFGAAVNEVARLEGLTKDLGRPVLVSDAFRKNCPQPTVSLGAMALRGIGREMEVFAPDCEAADLKKSMQDTAQMAAE
ncbi:MAG: adenylate/guanylate cyclase domain-containing protein [Pseudomonadota bacterium]